MAIETLMWLIPLAPLMAFGLIVLFTNRYKSLSHRMALGGAGIAWLLSMWVFFRAIGVDDLAVHPFTSTINWLPTGWTPGCRSARLLTRSAQSLCSLSPGRY